MPQQAWSAKRERQYEHIKDGLEERGDSEDLASEIAARTVNKERARAGESEQASAASIHDISSGRRGGLRSHKGAGGRTKDQLYAEARRKGVPGPLEDDEGANSSGRSTTSQWSCHRRADRTAGSVASLPLADQGGQPETGRDQDPAPADRRS